MSAPSAMAAPLWVLLLAVLSPAPITAAGTSQEIVDGSKPDALVRIIQDMGYRASLEVDTEGDPLIRSSVGGTPFALVFYGCSKDHDACQVLLFRTGYELERKVGIDVINRWNATRLFGRAYLDEVRDPCLELALNVKGGVTRAQFESTFEWWEASVGAFEDEIGV